jgi:hypothetical protein
MKKCVSAVRTGVCYLSHLSVLIVPRVCYLSHLRVLFVSPSVLIVTLLGWNIRKECIRKIKSVRKSLRGSLQIKVLQLQGGGTLGLSS